MPFLIETTHGKMGPFSSRQISKFVRAGRLSVDCRIRREGDNKAVWVADIIAGLISSTVQAEVAAPARRCRVRRGRSKRTPGPGHGLKRFVDRNPPPPPAEPEPRRKRSGRSKRQAAASARSKTRSGRLASNSAKKTKLPSREASGRIEQRSAPRRRSGRLSSAKSARLPGLVLPALSLLLSMCLTAGAVLVVEGKLPGAGIQQALQPALAPLGTPGVAALGGALCLVAALFVFLRVRRRRLLATAGPD